MIIIISEVLDSSTNDVMDWLLKFRLRTIRINKHDLAFQSIDFENNVVLFLYKNARKFNSEQISAFWYRRGYIGFRDGFSNLNKNDELQDLTYYHLNSEWEELIRFFTTNLEKDILLKSIGNYAVEDKKLDQLYLAKKNELQIPKTLITTQKEELLCFYDKCNKKLITKGISKSPSLTFNNNSLEGYTEEVPEELINFLPNTFFPSFFQENIIKQYELRIFFLKGSFYSMAIFSQSDEQTKIDVRKYNDTKPNRTVPYKLPKEIEIKLNQLMRDLNIDTGSIDMIVDNNDEFYFLEVNPNGQFGMVSVPCNYYIEKKIAEALT